MTTKIYLNAHTARINDNNTVIITDTVINDGELMDMTGGTITVIGHQPCSPDKYEFIIPKNEIALIRRELDNLKLDDVKHDTKPDICNELNNLELDDIKHR